MDCSSGAFSFSCFLARAFALAVVDNTAVATYNLKSFCYLYIYIYTARSGIYLFYNIGSRWLCLGWIGKQ
jgi:hypothetical protein